MRSACSCRRIAACAAMMTLAGAGCERSPPEPGAGATGTSNQQAASAETVDWAAVRATGPAESIAAMSRIARLLDVWHRGKAPRIELRYAGGVTDDAGHRAALSPEEWKGMLDLVGAGSAAARALPGGKHDYADGLGACPRWAYTVAAAPGDRLVFTVARAVEGGSQG